MDTVKHLSSAVQYAGKPCKKNSFHVIEDISFRYVKGNGCVLCIKERNRGHRGKRGKTNPIVRRREKLKSKYGISLDQYEELFKKQDGKCAICGKPPNNRNFDVDHDHTTGEVRGLLCNNCNTGLGKLNSIELLEKAIAYLSK